ncbi:hypothetical protein Xmau_03788 [Xenorhabdus mauleonii]|uniref:Uncharacterized protein n=1 Tax=Xenorhabdus mauleonii TaxID=351675 RepID=A0A1I3V7E0_9GAMM|nr:hypothetical protein [Xenorhabdus mauleonii]PHM37572.1 hypothetical protein Xmau_03788 [Xenorhabdus mauleonii]SFJ91060.1 hypothetical protein SAMN05421680_11978 [Xenorhabdus mauleonii]
MKNNNEFINDQSYYRRKITVIVCKLGYSFGIHFCNNPILSGSNSDLWFPLSNEDSIFRGIERIMVMNHIAQNVTSIKEIRKNGKDSFDYEVIYNREVRK